VNPNKLDHVAYWLADRDAVADFLIAHLGMHVVDRTDRFTLVGADARRGKLTLFAADGPREPGPLMHVALRVSNLERAARALPAGLSTEHRGSGELYFDVSEGLRLGLVEAQTDTEYDLDHVSLRCADVAAAERGWRALGFEAAEPREATCRVMVGGAHLELVPGAFRQSDRQLLNHLAVLVDSAESWRARAEDAGVEIDDVVDAPNTLAVFVWGPERIKLEYVEHKAAFSLR
jgi:catechol 2,3-dioxygenase-like lactoylglutathione lyase family enzyme